MNNPVQNPWLHQDADGREWMAVVVDGRLSEVNTETDVERLKRLRDWPDTQATVRKAIERRIKVLSK